MFRYYSFSTLGNNKDVWVRYITVIVFAIPIIVAIVLDQLKLNYIIPLYIFMGLFLPFAVIWIIIWFYHKWRIRHG